MSAKLPRSFKVFMFIGTTIAIIFACILIYGEDHPNSKIHKELASWGFWGGK